MRWFFFSTVGVLVLTLVLRTWVVLGLVEPVEVAASSMAPTLRGPHGAIICKHCGQAFDMGAEFAAEATWSECPNCGRREELPADLPIRRGDRLMIDRTAFQWRLPRRWEPVVFVSPADAGRMAVKRVVGLPGETVVLAQGDLWINGQRVRKSLTQQRALRQLVHRETPKAQSWCAVPENTWQWNDVAWHSLSAPDTADIRWLTFGDSRRPVHDDSSHNAGLSQRLHAVPDLCLTAKVRFVGRGQVAVRWSQEELRLDLATGAITLVANRRRQFLGRLTAVVLEGLQNREVLFEATNFDRQLLLAIDGQVVTCYPLAELTEEGPAESLLALGTQGLSDAFQELCVWRDVYFFSPSETLGEQAPPSQVQLEEDELFLLGDNVPVSLDSRQIGPLPVRLLVGKPVGVR